MDQQLNTAAVWQRKFGALALRIIQMWTRDTERHTPVHDYKPVSITRSKILAYLPGHRPHSAFEYQHGRFRNSTNESIETSAPNEPQNPRSIGSVSLHSSLYSAAQEVFGISITCSRPYNRTICATAKLMSAPAYYEDHSIFLPLTPFLLYSQYTLAHPSNVYNRNAAKWSACCLRCL